MAVPVIGGASLYTMGEVLRGQAALPPFPVSAAGFIASLSASVVAILFFRYFVRRYSTAWFALYLFPLALFLLAR
jgi:undecaprenyl pyrophosphate phosphatase UppP